MQRFRYLALFFSTCLVVVSLPLLRRVVSLALCGLLFANSSICYDLLGSDRASAAISGREGAATSGVIDGGGEEIVVPPIIREAPIDLQNALPNDFVVSRQTPYSSGRNEVLIASPSTGTEQRFEINLPGSGSFRLYRAAFSNILIDEPAQIVGGESQLSPTQIQAKLESFTINFDDNNLPNSVVLEDGLKAEFSDSEAIIRSVDGQVIETISFSSFLPSDDFMALTKSRRGTRFPTCKARIRNQLYGSGQRAGNISDALRNARSWESKAFAWTLTYGKRALEDSLVANARNQTLQEIACHAPVQCDQPRGNEGGSVIRTDLFQLPGGTNQIVELAYEFYEIEDRIELYHDGEMIFGVGPVSGSSEETIPIPNRAAYVGVKLIGNEDSGTKWWYTISCSGESVPQELLEAREIARRLRDVYPGWNEDLDPCPLTSDDADESDLFEEDDWITRQFVLRYHPGASTTYRSKAEAVEAYPSKNPELPGAVPLYPGQQCTYDEGGNLITGGTAAGTPDAYSPAVTDIGDYLHTIWDINPAKVMSLQEYHQTWTPNNGNSAPINIINEDAGVWEGRVVLDTQP
jgi:hypothetical protein